MNNLMRRHFMGGKSVDSTATVLGIETFSPDKAFTITLFSDGNYNFEVDWGDGTADIITTWNDANLSHNYSQTGQYDVVLTGTINGIKIDSQNELGGSSGRAALKHVKQWGTAQNWAGLFNCRDLISDISNDSPVSFRGNTMFRFFYACESFTGGINMNNWDVSSVTSFKECFSITSFNSDISNWDVSNATSFESMFITSNFNQDVSSWNVSKATTIREMFANCPFNGDISNWVLNPNSFVNINSLFSGNESFNNPNIVNLDVTRVNSMTNTFNKASSFNQDISSWNVSNVTNMAAMFRDATNFNQNIGIWDVSNVTDMRFMFEKANSFDQDLSSWNVTSLTDATEMFQEISLSTKNYDSLLIGWESQTVQNNVPFHGGTSQYTAGSPAATARQNLINDHNWTITDGGAI